MVEGQKLGYAGRPASASPAVGYAATCTRSSRRRCSTRPSASSRASSPSVRRARHISHPHGHRDIMAIIEVKVPQLSESVADATLLQWKKQPGEAVAIDEILVEIETDKVVLGVPAPAAGVHGRTCGGQRRHRGPNELIARSIPRARPRLQPRSCRAGGTPRREPPRRHRAPPRRPRRDADTGGQADGRQQEPDAELGARHRQGRPGHQGRRARRAWRCSRPPPSRGSAGAAGPAGGAAPSHPAWRSARAARADVAPARAGRRAPGRSRSNQPPSSPPSTRWTWRR